MDAHDGFKPLDVSEFAKRIRAKAGAYDDVDDADLVEKFVRKNPVYADKVALPKEFKLLHTTTGHSNLDSVYEQAGRLHNVDPNLLIEQGRKETRFDPDVLYGRRGSPKNAQGSGQFIPDTAKRFGVDVKDPRSGINGQAAYMRQLLDQFDDDENLALAGYNAGEGRKALKQGRVPKIPETQDYVNEITTKLNDSRKGAGGSLRKLLDLQQPKQPEAQPPLVPDPEKLVAQVAPVVDALSGTPAGRVVLGSAAEVAQGAIQQAAASAAPPIQPQSTNTIDDQYAEYLKAQKGNNPVSFEEFKAKIPTQPSIVPVQPPTTVSATTPPPVVAESTSSSQSSALPDNPEVQKFAADLRKESPGATDQDVLDSYNAMQKGRVESQNADIAKTNAENQQEQQQLTKDSRGVVRQPTQMQSATHDISDADLKKTPITYTVPLQAGDTIDSVKQKIQAKLRSEWGLSADQASKYGLLNEGNVTKEDIASGQMQVNVDRSALAEDVGTDKVREDLRKEQADVETSPGYLSQLEKAGRGQDIQPHVRGTEDQSSVEREVYSSPLTLLLGSIKGKTDQQMVDDLAQYQPTEEEKQKFFEDNKGFFPEGGIGSAEAGGYSAVNALVKLGLSVTRALGENTIDPNNPSAPWKAPDWLANLVKHANLRDAFIASYRKANPGFVNDVAYVGTNLVGSLPRYIGIGRLLNGREVLFAVDALTQTAGSGGTPGQMLEQTSKGLAFDKIFGAAPKVASWAEGKGLQAIKDFRRPLAGTLPALEGEVTAGTIKAGAYPVERLAAKIFGTTTSMGFVTTAGSTTARAYGSSPSESLEEGTKLAIMQVASEHGGDIAGTIKDMAGKIYRGIEGGKTVEATVMPDGEMKLLKGAVPGEVVDMDFVFDSKEGIYKAQNPFQTKQLTTDITKGEEGTVGYKESEAGRAQQKAQEAINEGENRANELTRSQEMDKAKLDAQITTRRQSEAATETKPAVTETTPVEPNFPEPAPIVENRPYTPKDLDQEMEQGFGKPTATAEKPTGLTPEEVAFNTAQQEKGAEIVSSNIESDRVGRRRAEQQVETERRQARIERRQAEVDPRTQLGSQAAWSAAQPRIEADPKQAVISADINRMKDANDTTSHDLVDKKVLIRLGDVGREVAKRHGLDVRNLFTPKGDELFAGVPVEKQKEVAEDLEKTFGTVNITVERDYTNSRTGESFKKGDVIPVTLSAHYGQTAKEAEIELGGRKEASKAANPIQRVGTGSEMRIPPGVPESQTSHKVATPQGRQAHLEQKQKTTPQLLLNLDFKNTPRGLEINSPTSEFTRRLLEAKSGKSFPVSDAQFHNPKAARSIAESVKTFADKYRTKLPPAITNQLDQYSRALGNVGKSGKVVYTFDEAVRHEQLHKLSYTSAGVKKLTERVKNIASFARQNRKLIEKAHAYHYVNYGYQLPDLRKDNFSPTELGQIAVHVEEIAVSTMDGDFKTLGFDSREAAEYLREWLVAYRDQHGIQSLKNFEKFFDGLMEHLPARDAIRSINEKANETKGPKSRKIVPPEPEQQQGETGQGDTTSPGIERERATIRSAEEANLVDHMDDRYYPVKSKDNNIRLAQERIEKAGLAQSVYEAVQNATVGQRAEHTAFQMEVVHLLNRQARKAMEAGDENMSKAKLAQAQDIVAVIAGQGTDYGQAISQLSEWQKDGDPDAVTGYVQKRRAQYGYAEALSPEQQELLRKAAEDLANLRQVVSDLQKQVNKIDSRLESKPQNPRATRKTNPNIERLQKQRDEIIKRLEENPLLTVAWHGSRVQGIKKMSTDYIGTGEGAQAYGYGLYFTDKEDIADYYRHSLAGRIDVTYKGKTRYELMEEGPDSEGYMPFEILGVIDQLKRGNTFEQAIDSEKRQVSISTGLSKQAAPTKTHPEYQKIMDHSLKVFDSLKESDFEITKPGAKYKVDLKPAEDEYLLWDKPLNKQSEKVQKILESAKIIDYTAQDKDGMFVPKDIKLIDFGVTDDATGKDLYDYITELQLDSPKDASNYLLGLGIRGNKYETGESRNKDKAKDYNYVIFDDNDVDIMEMLLQVSKEEQKKKGLLAPNGEPSNLPEKLYHDVRTPEFKKFFGDWEKNPKEASKVVDENGEPKVMYHIGAADLEGGKFDPNFGELGTHFGDKNTVRDITGEPMQGYWPGDEIPIVAGYPVFLNIRNPSEEEDIGAWTPYYIAHLLEGKGVTLSARTRNLVDDEGDGWDETAGGNRYAYRRLRKYFQELGFDGVEYINNFEGLTDNKTGEKVNMSDLVASHGSISNKLSPLEFEKKYGVTLSTSYIAFGPKQIKSVFTPPEGPLFQVSKQPQPIFYSQIERTLEQKMPNKASAEQVKNILKDTKKEERDWLGIDQWLQDNPNPTKDEVIGFVKANEVKLVEVMSHSAVRGNIPQDEEYETEEASRELGDALAEFLATYGTELNEQQIEQLAIKVQERAEQNDDFDEVYEGVIDRYVDSAFHEGEGEEFDKFLDDQSGVGSAYDKYREILYPEGEEGGTFSPRYQQYSLPGGENYRELLLTLPEQGKGPDIKVEKSASGKHWLVFINGSTAGAIADATKTSEQEALRLATESVNAGEMGVDKTDQRGNFISSHFDTPNILTHIRFDDRTDAQGRKTLHIAEIQSDWHQKGRKQGYKQPHLTVQDLDWQMVSLDEAAKNNPGLPRLARTFRAENKLNVNAPVLRYRLKGGPDNSWSYNYGSGMTQSEILEKELSKMSSHSSALDTVIQAEERKRRNSIPDAPFKKSWYELAIKRMLRYAVDNGYEALSWDTGETNADRYSLGSHVEKLQIWKDPEEGWYGIKGFAEKQDRNPVLEEDVDTPQKLEEFIGQELAQKVIKDLESDTEGRFKEYSGLDLKLGGEGMKGFYDKILPAFVNKYVKKWGAKVEDSKVASKDFFVQSVSGKDKWLLRSEDGNKLGTFDSEEAAFSEGRRLLGTLTHSVKITPAMQNSLEEAQPLFQVSKPLEELYNKDGEINYEAIKNTAEKVASGVYQISRLTPNNEAGRIAGGRRFLEASILLGAAENTSPTIKPAQEQENGSRIINEGFESRRKILAPQEERLERYAKQTDLWIPLDDPAFSDDLYIGDGLESQVFRDSSDPGFVIKRTNYDYAVPMTPQQFLDRLAIFNHLFPKTSYELIGVTRNTRNELLFVLRQPYVKKRGESDYEEVDEFMLSNYNAKPDPHQADAYSNSKYEISDLHYGNILKVGPKDFRVIDALIRVLPSNVRNYVPLEIHSTSESPLFAVSPDQEKDLIDYTALNIIDDKPLKETMDDLQKIAPSITDEERAEIHLKAWDMVYPHKTQATKTERARIRMEHLRQIQKTRTKFKAGPKATSNQLRIAEIGADENTDSKIIHAAIMLEGGEVRDANEAANAIKEAYPNLTAGEALNTASLGAKFRKEAKQKIAAENAELKAQKDEAEKKLRAEEKKKNVAQRELLNRIKSLEKPPPTYSQRIARLYKSALISAVQTSTNNFVTAQGMRKVELLTDFTELMINKGLAAAGREVRPEGIQPGTPMRDILGLSHDTDGAIDALKKNFTESVYAQSIANSVLDEFPTFYEDLFRSYSADIAALPEKKGASSVVEGVFRGLEFTYDKLNTLNKFQEFLVRSQEFNRQLQIRLGGKGLTLKGIIASGRLKTIDPNDIKYAVREALRVTFAMTPDKNTVFGKFINLYESKVPALLAPFLITFPRFTYNAGGFIADYTPGIGLLRAGLNAKEPGQTYWKAFAQLNSRDAARQLIGLLIFLTALSFVRAFGDDDKWYLLKVPGATKDGKPLYVDVRGWQPFAAFVFMANKINRLIDGKPMFSDPDTAIADTVEACLGLSTRNLVDNKFLAALWHGGLAVTSQGDEKEWERVSYLLQQQMGEIVGGFLRPLKTIKDVVGQFDEWQSSHPDLVDQPVLQGPSRSVPFFNSITGANLKRDYVTGEVEKDTDPGLKIFGVSLVDGKRHIEPLSPALVRIRELEEDYHPRDILPAKQRASQIKGDFWRAIRDAGTDLDKQKVITDKLEQATSEGKLTKGQADYIERGIGLTELQSHMRSASWDHVIQTVNVMSNEEKESVRPIIEKRLGKARVRPNEVEQKKLEDLGFEEKGVKKLPKLPTLKPMKSAFNEQ